MAGPGRSALKLKENKMKKSEKAKSTEREIKVTNAYLDSIANNSSFQVIVKKQFSAKTSYWLARVFNKLQREAKIYLAEKQKLVEKYAKRHEEDGEEKKDGKAIKAWKKGDMIGDGKSVSLNDVEGFTKEINELTEIEIGIGLNRIDFDLDKEANCTVEEMGILLPLIEVKE